MSTPTIYYNVVELEQYWESASAQLNTLGVDGWELSHIYNTQAVLISGSSGITVSGSVILPTGTVSSSAQATEWTVLSASYAEIADTASYVSMNALQTAYGQFYDTTIQSGSANSAQAMLLNTTDIVQRINVVSGSQITVDDTGVYNLQFSAQLHNTANSNITFDIWFAIDGVALPNSNTKVEIDKQPGTLGKTVAAWNILLPLAASQYAEIYWSSNASTGQLFSSGSTSNPTRPAIPSVIVTMTKIAGSFVS